MTSLASTPQAQLLAWDSEFWGTRIAATDHPDIDDWARAHTIGCMFMLARAEEIALIQKAEARGYKLTDVRVTLVRQTAAARFPIALVRNWEPEDIEPLASLARSSHRITRFYADERFDSERCDDLYEAWIRNSINGWAQQVFVTGAPGQPTGYITIHLDGDTSSIGLIAISPDARGQGLGTALCRAATAWAHQAGASRMTVVTQGRNLPALRLFETVGFMLTNVECWLHRWYT